MKQQFKLKLKPKTIATTTTIAIATLLIFMLSTQAMAMAQVQIPPMPNILPQKIPQTAIPIHAPPPQVTAQAMQELQQQTQRLDSILNLIQSKLGNDASQQHLQQVLSQLTANGIINCPSSTQCQLTPAITK